MTDRQLAALHKKIRSLGLKYETINQLVQDVYMELHALQRQRAKALIRLESARVLMMREEASRVKSTGQ